MFNKKQKLTVFSPSNKSENRLKSCQAAKNV